MHGDAFLAVESEEDGFGIFGQLYFYGGRVANDDGAIGERVRADRRDDEGLDSGMNDGAAGGKRVGGGTRGSRKHEAVGAIAADEIAINGKFELDHAGEGAFVHGGVVEDVLAIENFAVADELDLNHDALALRGAAGKSFFEGGVEFIHREAGEKAEAAHVDGENGNAAGSGDTRGGKKSTIAAENEKNIGLIGELFARVTL